MAAEENGSMDAAQRMDEARQLRLLKQEMHRSSIGIDPAVTAHVEATFAYGVAQTRYEYRGYANRNYHLIRGLGKRLVALLAALLVILAGFSAAQFISIRNIEEGRKAGAKLNCAIATSVIQAGLKTITTSTEAPLPPKVERFLVGLGYPTLKSRKEAAAAIGRAYTKKISEGVIAASGLGPKANVLNHDGTVNCGKLRHIARIK